MPTSNKLILPAAALCAALPAGCASTPRSAANQPAPGSTLMPQPSDASPDKPAAPFQAVPLSNLPTPRQPLPVLTSAQTAGLCTLPWSLVTTENDGRDLVLVIPASPQVVKGVLIDQTPHDVTVTVYRTPPSTGPALSYSVHATVLVQLPEPLAGRHLLGADRGTCP